MTPGRRKCPRLLTPGRDTAGSIVSYRVDQNAGDKNHLGTVSPARIGDTSDLRRPI
jgi:hypothetical protein